ncbi:MAG: thioredoxin family protein [Bdellovibrionaceae bacterium]|nr:thioredoxin family protein [Pseudobdellovibrionaceae bacterium]
MALHPIFQDFPMPQLRPQNFDEFTQTDDGKIVAVFFWGHNCPNCDVAKRMIHQEMESYRAFGFQWYHVNTYEDADLGTRFGLHGIPTFLFFKNRRLLGRATSFPGHDEFLGVLETLRKKHA